MNVKYFRKLIIIFMITSSFIFLCYSIKEGIYDRLLTYLALYPILIIPNLLSKINIKLNENQKLIYIIFIFFAYFLGSVVNLYNIIWWYDLFVHFISGIISFTFANIIKNNNKFSNKKIMFIYYIGFVALIACFWEVFEFTIDLIFKSNLQHNIETGVIDTMEDIIVALIGGIIAYIYKFNK